MEKPEPVEKKAFANHNEPIAIIGIAGIFPGSRTIPEFFTNVLRKRCFIRQVPDWLWEQDIFFDEDRNVPLKTYTRIGALLSDTEMDLSAFRIPPTVAAHMSRNQMLSLVCAREALADAGYLKHGFDREKVGVILAATEGELRDATVETILVRLIRARLGRLVRTSDEKRLADALWEAYETVYPGRAITEDTRAGESGNLVAGRIAAVFDLHGPNLVLDSACASSLAAVATAVNLLRAGMCDMVITGGVDTDMSLSSCIGLAKASALSATGSFPFDDRADGFVMGEGCGLLVLKRFADAVRDGDRIYALIRGCGGSSDGAGRGIMAPSSDGQLRALRRAYEDAGLSPAVLHFLECHGTGTQVGDAAELESVSRLCSEADLGILGQRALPIGSSKAMVGHLKMAAGAVGLMRAILALNSRVVPPQVNFEKPNPSFDWEHGHLRVPHRPEPIHDDEIYVGVSGFGFGGTNYHVVLSSPPVNAREPLMEVGEFILPGLPPLSNDIAFMFPGQGSQYVGMIEALRHDPTAQEFLAKADEVVAEISGRTISETIYPSSDGRDGAELLAAREAELRETAISQPAIFTVSAILLDQVRRLGIDCGMAMGHSLGEYTALYAAGILNFDDTLHAIALRGHLMDILPDKGSGTMAFVNAGPEMVSKLLREIKGYVVCANLNSYDQTVVSGDAVAIDALLELATSRGLQSRRLGVNGAFHTRYMSACREPFRKVLEKLSFRTTTTPVPANQSREVYPFVTDPRVSGQPMNEPDRYRTIDLMCRQIDHPVDFVRQIELAYEAGIRRFVEVGPKSVLAGLVGDILQGKPFQALHLDFGVKKRLGKLRNQLAAPLTISRRPLSLRPRSLPCAHRVMPLINVSQSLPDQVRRVVAQVSGYDVSQIGDDDEFERDLGIDTLKIFEIVTRLRGTVLPAKFSNFRQSTSVNKILALSSAMVPGQATIAAQEPKSRHVRDLCCFRYQTVETGPVGAMPQVLPTKRYRAVVGSGLSAMEKNLAGCPQFAHGESLDTLILWPLPTSAEELCGQTIPDLLRLVIGIADTAMRKPGEPEVHLITLAPAEGFNPAFFRALSGLVKSFQKDLSYLRFSYCHLDTLQPKISLLLRVLNEPILGRHVRPDGQAEEGRLVRMPETGGSLNELAELLGPEDVVLVTGGAGGIAASIVRHLLSLVRSRFLLVGRKARTETWITEEGQGRVEYRAADICDAGAIQTLGLRNRGITLVVHAAGIGAARPIREIEKSELSRILGVKIIGLQRVLEELDASRLRGIVSFSSIAGFFGGDGHPDYAAANGYLDGFTHSSVPVLTIGWSAWDEVGMATDTATRQFLELAQIEPISVREGVETFAALLAGFLKERTQGTRNILVRKKMGDGFFLPRDPLRTGVIGMEAGSAVLPSTAFGTCDLVSDHMPSQQTHRFPDAELEAAAVSLLAGPSLGDSDLIILKTLPAARYGRSRLDGLFTPAEREEIIGIAAERRRQEKLAGKLAVKILTCKVIKGRFGLDWEPSGIQVLSSASPVRVEIPGEPHMNAIIGTLFFSISHSDGLVCAAVAQQRVGIDIEKIRPLPEETAQAICDKGLHAERVRYEESIQGTADTSMLEKEAVPVVVFTQKEAVLKAEGIGLADGLGDIELDGFGIATPITASYRGSRYRVLSVIVNGYVLSLAHLTDVMPGQHSPDTFPSKTVPMSTGQEGIWFQEQLGGIGSTYNIGWSLRLRGLLNVRALAQSIQYTVDRHEALRTVFPEVNGVCQAQVKAKMEVPLATIDLGNMPMDDALAEAYQRCRQEVQQRFDLTQEPLIRAMLFRLQDKDHIVLFVFHHTIIDAFSELTFRKDLAECYRAFVSGQEPQLQPLPFQYGDFALRQREGLTPERLEHLVTYWREKLAGLPALLDLPTDHRRPAVQTFPAGSVAFTISAGLIQKLQDLGRSEGVTLFVTFLTAFQVLLMRLSGQDDIVVGAPFLGRDDTETYPVIGYYVNVLPLRMDLSGNPRFREVLPVVRETVMEALGHQELPFQKLVEVLSPQRSAAYPPIFQVVMRLLHETCKGVSLTGLDQMFEEVPAGNTAYDLSLIVGVRDAGSHGRIEYNRDLFTEATVQRMTGRFLRVLESVVEDPDLRLSEIPLMGSAEEFRIVRTLNDTRRPFPQSGIDQLFAEQVERTPGAVAIVDGDTRLTYRELNARANQLAHYLRNHGVRREGLVGLCMERSLEAIISLLGIVKAGGAYVPLDPTYPNERLSFMVKDTQPVVILTQETLRSQLPVLNVPVICIDKDWESISQESETNLLSQTHPEDLVYVMYTSGSTGQPKGVEVCHRGIVRLLFGVDYVELNSSQSFLQMAPLSFDASTFEIWGPLLHGGECVLFPDRVPSIAALGDVLQRNGVHTLWLTASLFNTVIDEAPGILSGIRQLLIGGEALSVEHVRRAAALLPSTHIINCYGPTESTTFACCYPIPRQVDRSATSIPIGRPIGNTKVYVLDSHLKPLPIGVPGELYIGGSGLARGYLNRGDLTAERFIPNPFSEEPGDRLYMTGDMARYLTDGTLEFLGRRDYQVKIRGYRIEPGEIETELRRHPDVRDAVVIAKKDSRGDGRLCACIMPRPGTLLTSDSIGQFLRKRLPDFMIPQEVFCLDAFPFTPSGKIDRHALCSQCKLHPVSDLASVPSLQPRDSLEEDLVRIWEELLGVRPVGTDEDFFDLGGTSLMVIRLCSRLEKEYQKRLSPSVLFQAPTIERLAAFIHDMPMHTSSSSLIAIKASGSRPPLFCFPHITGPAVVFRHLLQYMNQEQPVYAIDGSKEILSASVEETASSYIDEIRKMLPNGPFLFLGFSSGGVIAFEMARQLHAMNCEVLFLGMLDTFCPIDFKKKTSLSDTAAIARSLKNFPFWLYYYVPFWLNHYMKKTKDESLFEEPPIHEVIKRLHDYTPHYYKGRIVFYRSRAQGIIPATAHESWRTLAEQVEVHIVPGHHTGILKGSAVRALAKKINAELYRSVKK